MLWFLHPAIGEFHLASQILRLQPGRAAASFFQVFFCLAFRLGGRARHGEHHGTLGRII